MTIWFNSSKKRNIQTNYSKVCHFLSLYKKNFWVFHKRKNIAGKTLYQGNCLIIELDREQFILNSSLMIFFVTTFVIIFEQSVVSWFSPLASSYLFLNTYTYHHQHKLPTNNWFGQHNSFNLLQGNKMKRKFFPKRRMFPNSYMFVTSMAVSDNLKFYSVEVGFTV